MPDPVAEAMQPMMDTLYARWLEQDIDAGLVDPDMFYERHREMLEERFSQARQRLALCGRSFGKKAVDDACRAFAQAVAARNPDIEYVEDPAGRWYGLRRRKPDGAYEGMLADMGIEAHEYEERERP